MPCNSSAADPSHNPRRTALDRLDQVDSRLYDLEHLFTFISNIAGASERDAQADQVKAESIQVVFSWLAREMVSIREMDMTAIRKEIASC